MVNIILKIKMGRHAEWRKIAKKERRKRIRIIKAKERDQIFLTDWYIKQQELEEKMIHEQINKQNEEENEKWIQAEKIVIEQWKKLQEEKERLKQKRLEQEAKLKVEWELEKKKKEIEEQRIKAAQEELKRKQDIFMNNLDLFLSGDSDEPPAELNVMWETRPDAELCPFFSKTACCRFGDLCSRNHQYPGISKVLLATNFYNHFGLSNANVSEYDTDIMLEFEDSDTYKEYKEFFFDVLSEFEKFGRITQFKSKRRIALRVRQSGHGGGLNPRKKRYLKEQVQEDMKEVTDVVTDLVTVRKKISITDVHLLDGVNAVNAILDINLARKCSKL